MRNRKKKRPKNPERRGIYILPNLFTSASLFSGFYAMILAIQGQFETSAIAILVSCVLDGLDGKVARATGSSSHFGTEYDSLSDVIAFGVAPGILAYTWAVSPFEQFGLIGCFLFVICGALRLARFNVQKAVVGMAHFRGLPIPAAASVIASWVLFSHAIGGIEGGAEAWFTLLSLYVLSFLMVSTIPYNSFKEFELKKAKPFNLLVTVVLFLLVVAYKPNITLFFLLSLYALSGPILFVYRHRRGQPEVKEALVPPSPPPLEDQGSARR